LGDGVTEWATVSVPTRTVAGSNLNHGRLISLGSLKREAAIMKPTGAKFEHVFTNLQTYQPPLQINKQTANDQSCRA